MIQNASFEQYILDAGSSQCVTDFSHVNNWQPIQSPDVFTSSCTFTNHYGVPNNRCGSAYPKNGNAYVGIASYYKTMEVKEDIFQHLNNPLIAGKSYYVSFYTSRADRVGYAIKNIGAYFSVVQPTVSGNTYLPATPQVKNQSEFLTDTIGWTMIEGYFTAQGGEEYITIGNFNSNADTDTLYSGTTNPIPFDNGMSYYYIDSVSLYDALTITGLKDMNNETKFNLYPNPTEEMLNVKLKMLNDRNAIMIKITDVLGKEVLVESYKEEVDVSHLEQGIYFFSLYESNRLIGIKKIIKE